MPKYFYTDPLKAAWMAREFGVKIYAYINVIGGNNCRIGDVDCKIHKEIDEDPIMYLNPSDCFQNPRTLPYAGWQHAVDKWHIHTDSLHILETKEGDFVLLIFTGGIYLHCTLIKENVGIYSHQDNLANDIKYPGKNFPLESLQEGSMWDRPSIEIIKRDGKAFFMPEVEND